MPTTALRGVQRPGKNPNPSAAPDPRTPATHRTTHKVTGIRVLRSEWAKFWSLRSSWITLCVAVFLLIVFGAVASYTYSPDARHGPPGRPGSVAIGDRDTARLAVVDVVLADPCVPGVPSPSASGEHLP
ncbi:ABC transporter permease OS=Streptomyces aurantiogriseus OX=66870 GN=GCM10010251_34320 PE=4 SV=1 [Streptomyces aurantiogriseus]